MAAKYLFSSCTKQLQQQQFRYFSQTQSLNRIENVMIIGSGLMGSGVAQSCATSGRFNSITLQDVSQEQLDKARKRIHQSLAKLKEQKRSMFDGQFSNSLFIYLFFLFYFQSILMMLKQLRIV